MQEIVEVTDTMDRIFAGIFLENEEPIINLSRIMSKLRMENQSNNFLSLDIYCRSDSAVPLITQDLSSYDLYFTTTTVSILYIITCLKSILFSYIANLILIKILESNTASSEPYHATQAEISSVLRSNFFGITLLRIITKLREYYIYFNFVLIFITILAIISTNVFVIFNILMNIFIL